MQGEKERVRDTTEGSGQQPEIAQTEEPNPVGQDSPGNEYGEIGEKAQPGAGSVPPRSMGTRGSEFGEFGDHDDRGQQGQSGTGQADLGSQAGATLSGHADQQELGEIGGEVDQPASYGGASSPRSKATASSSSRKAERRRPEAVISHRRVAAPRKTRTKPAARAASVRRRPELRRLFGEERRLALDPVGEARPRQD